MYSLFLEIWSNPAGLVFNVEMRSESSVDFVLGNKEIKTGESTVLGTEPQWD